jgi:hypothetical protein
MYKMALSEPTDYPVRVLQPKPNARSLANLVAFQGEAGDRFCPEQNFNDHFRSDKN